MEVRYLQNTEELVEIAPVKHEEQPPLEEIVQSLALLALVHQGPPKPGQPQPSMSRTEEEEKEEEPKPPTA